MQRNKKRNLFWYCEGHTASIVKNPEHIKEMVDAGMIGLQIGIESGSNDVLKAYNKQINTGMLLEAVKICKAAKLTRLVGNFIVGGASETEETIMESIRLAEKKLEIGKGMFECKTVFLAPYPQTPVTIKPEKYNLEYKKEDAVSCVFSMYNPLMKSKFISYEKLISLKEKFDKNISETIKRLSAIAEKDDVERNFFKFGERIDSAPIWKNNYLKNEHIVNYLEGTYLSSGQKFTEYSDNQILKMYPVRTFNLLKYKNGHLVYGDYYFDEKETIFLKNSAGKLTFKEISNITEIDTSELIKLYYKLNNLCLIYVSEF